MLRRHEPVSAPPPSRSPADSIRSLAADLALRSPRGRLALAAIALALAAGALHPFTVSLARLGSALHHAREGPEEGRRRQFGNSYTAGVETLRQTIGRDEPYALTQAPIEGGDPSGPSAAIEGSALWIRFDLAPRKAVDLGPLEKLADGSGRSKGRRRLSHLPPEVRWVVVAHDYRSRPEILSREEFLASIAGRADAP